MIQSGSDLDISKSGSEWFALPRSRRPLTVTLRSNDLITWSEQRHILVSPPTAGNTWAPEAYYDDAIGAYAVFWASSLYDESDTNHTGTSYNRMLYATTQDFITFTSPQIWQDAGTSRIDSTVLKSGDLYYRFSKDEGPVTNCSDIIQESSPVLLDPLPAWKPIATCIGREAGLQSIEGPTAFKSNPGDVRGDKFYLLVDEYGGSGRGYIPLETTDISQPDWKISPSYNLPTSPRHGTVLPITAAELASINKRESAALIPGLYADPNLVVFGCNYYLYATTDGFAGWAGNQFYVWKSSDLINWQRSASAILILNGTAGNVPWATGNAWAPTAVERNGKFYFYFSGQNPVYNRKTIGVAIGNSPEGPFTAEATAMILNNEAVVSGQAIDPAAFFDPITKKFYLYWGNGNPLMAELTENMTSLIPSTLQSISGLQDFREGSFVVYRAPFYHMTYSIDDTGSPDYRVGYATSENATGPWVYRGVVLRKDVEKGILGTGHDSIVNVPRTDDWFIAYHRFAMSEGDGTHRESTIDRVLWDEETGLMREVVPSLNGVEEEERVPGCGAYL